MTHHRRTVTQGVAVQLLSRVQLFATSWTAARQASLSFTVAQREMLSYESESEVAQSLCDPMDYSLPGSSVHGIFQAKILEWVAISFSRDLPNPGIKPRSPALQADSLPSKPPGKPQYYIYIPYVCACVLSHFSRVQLCTAL